jgi:hypothetical protein
MRDIYKVDLEEIKKVKWQGDTNQYDLALHELGKDQDEFIVLNPTVSNINLYHYIHEIPDTDRCVFWYHEGEWVAKYFKKTWTPKTGYKEIEIIKPEFAWRKNPDLDRTMTFEDDPFGVFEPAPWDSQYELVWYMDPRFNPLYDKVWAISCKPIGVPTIGVKDMGYVTPQVDIEFNEDIPPLNLNIDDCYPAYYDLLNECAWELDPIHLTEIDDRMWVVKFTPRYRKPKEWQWYGVVTPEFIVEYNPVLGELDYDFDLSIPWYDLQYEHVWMLDNKHLSNGEEEIWALKIKLSNDVLGSKIVDYISPELNIEYNTDLGELNYNLDLFIPWYDLGYEHVWMLDNKHLNKGEEEIWAFKIRVTDNLEGSKIVGYISPNLEVEYNKDLPSVDYNIDYNIPWYDLSYEHIWYLTEETKEKVWAVKLCAVEEPTGEKDMGSVSLIIPRLDVIFISYNEPNAETNWQRVLEKAPWAKRVNGVKGIFNAHKAAAKLSKTDMFYVVDGDAYLADDWQFDFEPNIFDRDCAYVWSSRNPINDLVYGYGGVKLFPRTLLMKKRKWTTLDMFTGIADKLKVMDAISNVTQFNTDNFSTWRSAFRECAKLSAGTIDNQVSSDTEYRLKQWTTVGLGRKFGKYAVEGAQAGYQYATDNKNNQQALSCINDYTWLQNQFNLYYNKQ